MADITNDAQLKSLILKDLQKAIQDMSNEIASKLQANVAGIYDMGGDSDYYERTYEFFNAVIIPVVTISGNDVNVTLGMDSDRINASWARTSKQFNHHMSFNGEDVSQALLTWWDEGTTGAMVGDRQLPSLPATQYWTSVFGGNPDDGNNFPLLEKAIDDAIKKHLGKFGTIT